MDSSDVDCTCMHHCTGIIAVVNVGVGNGMTCTRQQTQDHKQYAAYQTSIHVKDESP